MGMESFNNPKPQPEIQPKKEPITINMAKNEKGEFEAIKTMAGSTEKIDHDIELEIGSMVYGTFIRNLKELGKKKEVEIFKVNEQKMPLSSVLRIRLRGERENIISLMENIKNTYEKN